MSLEGFSRKQAASAEAKADKQSERDRRRSEWVQNQTGALRLGDRIAKTITGNLPSTERLKLIEQGLLEETLESCKEEAKQIMQIEADSFSEKQELGPFFENAFISNELPEVIISEDVKGRFMSSVMKRFINKVTTLIGSSSPTVPVMSYPVGRNTPEELRQQILEELSAKLNEHPGARVLICTDSIETGKTIAPLIQELKETEHPIKVLYDYDYSGGRLSELGLQQADFIPLRSGGHGWNLGDNAKMQPIVRDLKESILASELEEDRPYRIRAVNEIADALYDSFIERPKVKEYLKGLST